MSNTILSPNMGLPIPVPGVDPGPDYSNNLNASLLGIDSHNHSAGSGVQITPSGINVNADFAFNGNNSISLRSDRFTVQVSALSGPADLACIYAAGTNGDLYFNDQNGNQIRITQNASVTGSAGTITGLPSGTASASFGSSTFVFQAATSTAATMDFGTIKLRSTSALSNAVTITPPSSLSSGNYPIVLPGQQSSQSFLAMDTSGSITGFAAVSGGITGAMIAATTVAASNIVPGTITHSQISATANITGSQLSPTAGILPTQLSTANYATGNCAASTTNGPSGAYAVAATVTVNASGARPMMVSIQTVTGGSQGYCISAASLNEIIILRDSTIVYYSSIPVPTAGVNPPSFYCVDFPPVGSPTYTVKIRSDGTHVTTISGCALVCAEL